MIFLFGLALMFRSALGQTPCSSRLNSTSRSLEFIFSEMSKVRQAPRGHPDMVAVDDFARLSPGQTIFIDAANLRTRVFRPHASPVLRFTVQAAAHNKLIIFSKKYGSLYFSDELLEDLWGFVYRRVDFRRRSPFLPGEYVQIGWPGATSLARPVMMFNLTSREIQPLNVISLPLVTKYIRTINEDLGIVQMTSADNETSRFRVARRDIYHLEVGHGRRLREILAPLFGGPPTKAQWGLHPARAIRVDTSGYLPRSPLQLLVLEETLGLVRAYLDGAARVESHPDFLAANFGERLRWLLRYQDLVVPWSRAGLTLENTGFRKFSEVICAGVGVCRHKAPLLALVLAKAGIEFRILYRTRALADGRLEGHTWLEVEEPRAEGQTYLVDPSDGVVQKLSDILLWASQAPASSAAIWWGHSERRVLPIEFLD